MSGKKARPNADHGANADSAPMPSANPTVIPHLDRFLELAGQHAAVRDVLHPLPALFEQHFDQLFHDLHRANPEWAAKLLQWWEPSKQAVYIQAARHDFHASYLTTAGAAWDQLEPQVAALFGAAIASASSSGRRPENQPR